MRLLCAVFSLPILPDSANPSGGEVNDPVNEVGLNRLEQKASHKLLLIGPNRSGTSTIFKQVKTYSEENLYFSCTIFFSGLFDHD